MLSCVFQTEKTGVQTTAAGEMTVSAFDLNSGFSQPPLSCTARDTRNHLDGSASRAVDLLSDTAPWHQLPLTWPSVAIRGARVSQLCER